MAKTNDLSRKQALKIEKCDKRINTVVFVFALIFFSLFTLVLKDYTNITLVKYNTFLIISLPLILYYIYEKGSLALTDGYFKRTTKSNTLTYVLISLFLFFNIISVLFSPYKQYVNSSGKSVLLFGAGRYDGLIVLALLVICFFIFSFEKILNNLFVNVVSISACLSLLIGFLQIFGFNPLKFYTTMNFYTSGQSFATTLGNIDVVSTYLCVVFALIAFSYIALKANKACKAFWLTTLFFSVLFLIKINVDSGKIALLVTLAIALPLLIRKKDWFLKLLDVFSICSFAFAISSLLNLKYDQKIIIKFNFSNSFFILIAISILCLISRVLCKKFLKESYTKSVCFGIVAVEILLLVAAIIYIKNADFENQTFKELSLLLNGKADDSFGSHRLGLWKYTLQLCKKRLFFGFGTGSFKQAFVEFMKNASPEFSSGGYDFAHNEFLQILYNCGIFGLISYLGFLAILIVKSFKVYLQSEKITVLVFAVVCYLSQAFFTFSIVLVSPLFWILLGMLTFEIRNFEKQKV